MTATPTVPPALPANSPAGGGLSPGEKQAKTDAGQLKLLVAFHAVHAGFSLLGLGFLLLHHTMINMMLNSPEIWENAKNPPPPAEFFAIFQYFYLGMGLLIVIHGLVNALSAWFIHRRRARMFSLIVAGMNCPIFPFGIALGVFTFIVLLRESVETVYKSQA